MAEKEKIILVDDVWKRYGLPLFGLNRSHPWALSEITFDVDKGEAVGIIGRNGAGKSTLLKLLAGVTPPTRGRIEMSGRIFPMIELNAGIHEELTGRENAKLLGSMLGLPRSEINGRIEEIADFCELGEWFDKPVRKYSSGMLARLGFGVGMHVSADILLVDEVLSVGDFTFQKKCIDHIAKLSNSGVTLLFVSHNPYIVERMCDRVILITEGKMTEIGEAADVIHKYYETGGLPAGKDADEPVELADTRPGTGDVRIMKVEVFGPDESARVTSGDEAMFRLHYRAKGEVKEPNFGIRIFDSLNTIVLSLDATEACKGKTLSGEGFIDCHVDELPLMPNVFNIQIKVVAQVLADMVENAARFTVVPKPEVIVNSGNKGIAYAEPKWDFHE